MERKARELKIGETPHLAAGAIDDLMAYDWPGNVRELGNVVERMIALPGVSVVDLIDRPLNGAQDRQKQVDLPLPSQADLDEVSYRAFMQQFEDHLLNWALGKSDGNISRAAKILDLPRSTLRSKLENQRD